MTTCIEQSWLERHPQVIAWLAGRKAPKGGASDRAHPYPPGSGPRGQSCGTCAKLCTREYRRKFFKCRVLMKHWTRTRATDVQLRDAACLAWEPDIDKLELVTTRLRNYGRIGH